jgi:hypothetical protein
VHLPQLFRLEQRATHPSQKTPDRDEDEGPVPSIIQLQTPDETSANQAEKRQVSRLSLTEQWNIYRSAMKRQDATQKDHSANRVHRAQEPDKQGH